MHDPDFLSAAWAGLAGEQGDTKTRTKRPTAAPAIPELVSGHYLLDFGYTTKGINKSKKVKLTNMGMQQVSRSYLRRSVGFLETRTCKACKHV